MTRLEKRPDAISRNLKKVAPSYFFSLLKKNLEIIFQKQPSEVHSNRVLLLEPPSTIISSHFKKKAYSL